MNHSLNYVILSTLFFPLNTLLRLFIAQPYLLQSFLVPLNYIIGVTLKDNLVFKM